MTTAPRILFILLLALVGAALFILPHHRRDMPDSTLRGTLVGLLTLSEPPPNLAAMLIMLLAALGCLSVLAPAALALLAMITPPDAHRTVLIVGGVALLLGGGLTLGVEIVSDLQIGFGGGGSTHTETPIFFLAPLWPIACGVAAIVAGAMNLPMP
jgi:hypothetical protein